MQYSGQFESKSKKAAIWVTYFSMGGVRESHQTIYLQLSSILSRDITKCTWGCPNPWHFFLHVMTESLQVNLNILCFESTKNNVYISFNVYTKVYMEQYCYVYCINLQKLCVQRDFDFAYIK